MSNENYGMLEQGYIPKPLSKFIAENIEMFKEIFGGDIDSTSMNPLIKINEVLCRGFDYLELQNANYFDSSQITTAEDRFLDDLMIAMGKERKQAQFAITVLTFTKTKSSNITIPSTTIVDNNSATFLKEFKVDENINLPTVFVVTKGAANGIDFINADPSLTNFFSVDSIEWISDSVDGTNPYVSGVDYVGYISNSDYIDWSLGGTEPTTGNYYYVKVGGYSAYIEVTAVVSGSAYNAEIGEIYHLQRSINGIGSVINENSINNGRNTETNLELRNRGLNAAFLLGNDRQMASWLLQLHRIQSANVFTLEATHFRSIVYPADPNNLIYIFNQCIDEVELRKSAGTQSVAIIRMVGTGAAPVTEEFPSPYSQVQGVSGTWQIEWVAANSDGTGAYVEGVNYTAYADYDNEINWIAGAPGLGVQYFVKLIKVVEIAETFPIAIYGRLSLADGYDLDVVNNDLFIELNSFINRIGISNTLYLSDIIQTILNHEGVLYVDNLRFRITMRLWKGAAAGTDNLYLNGSGYSDSGDTDVLWINDEKDQSGVNYPNTAWNWSISPAAGVRRIDWSPAGAEPTTNYPYWLQADVKGDITLPDDIILVLSEVEFV